MALLPDTLQWALAVELDSLQRAVERARTGSLAAVGSGGSLSTAHALAAFHRATTGHLAAVLTPYDASNTALHRSNAVWLLSASGNNVDIVNAARSVVMREHRQVVAFAGRADSKLTQVLSSHPYAERVTYPPPAGRDGFLATNSLLGFTTLLARAYGGLAQSTAESDLLLQYADPHSALLAEWRERSAPLWESQTIIVLHGASTAVGAIDLESKFTEAALGQTQIADFRNFAHGRHHWIAKHPERTAVLALVSAEDQDVASRTLRLIPPTTPVVRLDLPLRAEAANIASLLAAFHLSGWAGAARRIDPGDPGVPEFGRKLFHLAPSRQRSVVPAGWTRRAAAAVERKAGCSIEQLRAAGTLEPWKRAHDSFRSALGRSTFTGVVLDYDGTLVETRDRFDHPRAGIVDELTRLLRAEFPVGIATGRGKSVREELTATLPPDVHDRVLIGYYNGAEVSPLGDRGSPHIDRDGDPRIQSVKAALAAHPDLNAGAHFETRPDQLTITRENSYDETRLWRVVSDVVARVSPGLRVTRSSHSVDVVTPRACKLHVVERLRELASGVILTIGDRGDAPGNDDQLLSVSASLSVDECSPAPDRCWNLGARGQRGPQTTLEYLQALDVHADRTATLNLGRLR